MKGTATYGGNQCRFGSLAYRVSPERGGSAWKAWKRPAAIARSRPFV